MKGLRWLSIVLVIVHLASLPGCGRKEDESGAGPSPDSEAGAPVPTGRTSESPQAGGTVDSTTDGAVLKEALALWEAGEKDDAVRRFLAMQWSDPSVYRDMPVLVMSDQQFRSLPYGEAKRIVGCVALSVPDSLPAHPGESAKRAARAPRRRTARRGWCSSIPSPFVCRA